MNPEIWAIIQTGEVSGILEDLASDQNLHLRKLLSVSEALGLEEPPGGIILAIETSGEGSSYLTVIKRFTRTFIQFDTVVFSPSKEEGTGVSDRTAGVDLHVSVPVDREDFFVRVINLIALRRLKCAAGIVGLSLIHI